MTRSPVSPDAIEATMLRLAMESGPGKSIGPADVARVLGGPHPDGWGPLMQPVRRVAVRLMKEGRIVILRKGRPVDDPDEFRGVYRLALAPGATGEGAGNGSSM
jgi:hypothetical protein